MGTARLSLLSGVAGCIVLAACSSFGSAPPSDAGASLDGGIEARVESATAFDGGVHSYEVVVVEGGITWSQAMAAAEARGGHLATIATKEENAFVWSLVMKTPGAIRTTADLNRFGSWLGGVQDANGQEPGGGWRWITGEPWVFTQWANKEPNNDRVSGGGADEEWLHFYAYNASAPTWADGPNDTRCHSYVIEWE